MLTELRDSGLGLISSMRLDGQKDSQQIYKSTCSICTQSLMPVSETLLKGIIKDLKQTQKHTHIYIKMADAKILPLDFSFNRAKPVEKKTWFRMTYETYPLW